MATDNLPGFISSLLQAHQETCPKDSVRLVQTHISFVLLAGDHVYKFKKPVDFGFLDFSTLKKRQQCCEQELQLNRRLCPDIYLDLVTVTQEDENYTLNGKGEVVEYGVKMSRMPEENMMGNLIQARQLNRAHIDAIVAKLIPFYQQADRTNEIDGYGTAGSVAVNVLENFDQTKGFISTTGNSAITQEQFDKISSWSKEFLSRKELFNQRIKEGNIRDCHGDLYSANICLAEEVYIYDCIEFNRRFRYCDVASDIGFLAMDLDFHGLQELSSYCIDQFCQQAGDTSLKTMLNFYKCYRAYVRGKIGLFTAADPAVDEAVKQSCTEAAAKYFALAESYTS
jgi:aminoglycoside phosphotransferase family enzyme